MIKRTFGVGAVTVLAGCGGLAIDPVPDASPTPSPTATTTTTSVRPAPSPPKRPTPAPTGTGTSPSPTDPDGCPRNVPLTSADLDKDPGWKAATAAPGACTSQDIMTLESNFKSTAIKTYFDLGNGLSASCAACALSKDTDVSWGPIVGEAANNGETGFINFGACFGHLEGASCGKALQYEQFCYGLACDECTTTSTERAKCIEKAGSTGGMCAAFGDTTAKACPNIATSAKKCNSIIDAVKTLCGTQ